jgi:protein-tyrosine phosphatase
MVAWLLLHGQVPDVKAAIVHLRARRSTFGMPRAQVAFIERLTKEWHIDAQGAKPDERGG